MMILVVILVDLFAEGWGSRAGRRFLAPREKSPSWCASSHRCLESLQVGIGDQSLKQGLRDDEARHQATWTASFIAVGTYSGKDNTRWRPRAVARRV